MDIGNKDHLTPKAHTGNVDGIKTEAEINPDLEKLRIYTRIKLQLADQLRIVRQGLMALGRENGERQCGELMVKLAEDRFILAVLGQFKRGKSSLMNAIIGSELLPTGVLPLTSAITILKYGPAERLVVSRDNLIFPEELPVSSLPDYVTEKGNPGNWKKVKTACIELPVPFLQRGIEFVDTPGVGSAITANTATTYDFLPECDAVLFVTSVDMPMTSLELEFLKEIQEYVDKIFFIVNKIDLVVDGEQDEVLGFVAKTIQSQTGYETVKVFPVSARLGLAARTSGDAILYEQSGLKALEETLASFLSGEKSAAFLTAVARKSLRILDDETAQGAFSETALQARSKAMQKEEFVTIRRDPYAAAAAVMETRVKLEVLYKGISDGKMTEVKDIEVQLSVTTDTISKSAVNAMNPMSISVSASMASMDMATDLQTRGCPVCHHMAKQTSDFFARSQYQLSTEEPAQNRFAAELGFCPLHTWQLLAISSPQGASVGYARLSEHIAHLLREGKNALATGNMVKRLVRDSRHCRVCELLCQTEEVYIRQFIAMISETAGQNQYDHSQGACLRHLGMLINATSSAESREFLLSHAARCFEQDTEDMRSYAMKHDALRRSLQNRNEEDAYRRAIIRIVGDWSLCMPWAEDGEI